MVGYVQLAHNRRVGGVTRAEVLLNLGREDELDLEGLRRLARSITRYVDGEPPDAGEAAGEGLEVVSSRPFGGAYVLDALWRRMGSPRRSPRRSVRGGSPPTSSGCCSRSLANRALRPCSKLAAAEWASKDVHIPGLEAMDDDQAYRAMDVASGGRLRGRGAAGGVLRGRRPAQPRGPTYRSSGSVAPCGRAPRPLLA